MSLFRQLLTANSQKKKRPYYCEVEYLESTGTQYIDTGVQEDTTCIINMQATQVKDKTQVFLSNDLTGTRTKWFGASGTTNYYSVGGSNGVSSVSATTRKECVVTFTDMYSTTRSSVSFYFKDNPQTVYSGTDNISGVIAFKNICVGCICKEFPSYIKLFGLKIYNTSNILLRDFIPVLDWDMKPCMYDKVSGELLYNAGTGEFLYGREIHKVKYLESTSTQYIDTGVTQNSNIKAKLSIYPTVINKFIFGSRVSSGTDGFGIFMHSNNGGSWYSFFSSANAMISGFEVNKKYDIEFSKDGFIVNNNLLEGPYTKEFTGALNMYLFAMNSNGVVDNRLFIGKIYSTKLYDNNVLVRDYIPAVDENGVGFMFDRVSHTIFDNAGTGAFCYPPVELEYLEASGTQYINTNYKPVPATTKFELLFTPTSTTANFIFGARIDTSAGANSCTTYKPDIRIRKDWAGSSDYFTLRLNTTDKFLYTAYDNTVSLNDEIYTGTVTRSTTRLSYDFALFTVNTAGKFDDRIFVGKIYYAKLWDDGVLVRDFIPCFKDGQVGMWDKVNNILYTNAGTGSFVIGKIVESVIC